MTPRRYELSDFERSVIQPLLPNKRKRRCADLWRCVGRL